MDVHLQDRNNDNNDGIHNDNNKTEYQTTDSELCKDDTSVHNDTIPFDSRSKDIDDTAVIPLSKQVDDQADVNGTISKFNNRRIWKNIYVIGIVFWLNFTAYIGLADLQSSLFIDQGLGVICQAIVYISMTISSLLLPKLIIHKFGHKWTIIASISCYIIWMSANGYATWVTMGIASVLLGVAAGPLWTAHNTFINTLAIQYSKMNRTSLTTTVSLFFGVSNGIYKLSRVVGSLLSWSVLQKSWQNSTSVEDVTFCGAEDCPWLNMTNIHYEKPPAKLIWLLVGIYLSLAVLSVILAGIFLDNLPVTWYRDNQNLTQKAYIAKSLTSVFKLHKDYHQWLLIPTFMYTGIIQTFLQATFNKSYVTCSLGIWMVGLVLLPGTVGGVGVSFLSGRLGKVIGSHSQLLGCFLIDIGVLLFCLFWKPTPDNLAVFFVMCIVMFLAETIETLQILAVIGVLYPNEDASFANFRLWQSVGYSISYGTSNALCVSTKIYLVLAILALTIGCYIALVYVTKRKKHKESIVIATDNK